MSIEQLSTAVKFVAFFTNDGEGATGLTVTVDVRNPAGTEIVTAAAATEIGDGFYSYTLASGSTTTEGEYLAVFKTAGTVDQAHLPSLWVIGRGGVENLDAAVSTRNATTPPTAATIRSEIDTNSTKLDAAVSTRATPAQVTVIVSAIAGGGGSVEYANTVEDDDGDPMDGVNVWVTTGDSPADNVVATGTTDAFGHFSFLLDPGTYYLWAQRAGHNFDNPTEIEVTA
jgi:hypothetical protein